jgi:HD superfamily phosphohydrolase YqeK
LELLLQKLLKMAKKHYLLAVNIGRQSKTHGWEHVKRVAENARIIAGREGKKGEGELAYIAGLFHDWVRGAGNERHAEQSAREAGRILKNYLPEKELRTVLGAIGKHSFEIGVGGKSRAVARMPEFKNMVEIAVFLGDKIEQMDENAVWRRNLFLSENLRELDVDACIAYWKKRMEALRVLRESKEGRILFRCFPDLKRAFGIMDMYYRKLLGREREAVEMLKFAFAHKDLSGKEIRKKWEERYAGKS